MKKNKQKFTYLVKVDIYDLGDFKIVKKPKKKGVEPLPFNTLEDAIKDAIRVLDNEIQSTLAEAEHLENEAEEMDLNKQRLLKKLKKVQDA